VLGYVFDSSAVGVKQILGVPGAALVAGPIPLAVSLAGAVSAWPDSLLAVAEQDRQVLLLNLSNGAERWRPVAGLAAGPDEIVLSPGGRSAALLYRGASRAVVLTGLSSAPQVARAVEITRSPISLAVNDEGALLAIGYDTATLVSGPNGDSKWLMTLGPPLALAFSRGGNDLLLADPANHAVYLVRDLTGASAVIRLAGEREGISQPVGVAFSSDDRRAIVADAGAQTIVTIDLAGGVLNRVACRVKPTGLYPLGSCLFRFTAPLRDGPLWVYDARPGRSRVFFAPSELKTVDLAGPQTAANPERSEQ
jgi:DNA-binding beta-propeller fold protein YncE